MFDLIGVPYTSMGKPGGLTWAELHEIASEALTDQRRLGISVVIYNPEQDPDRTAAARIVNFLSDLAGPARS